MNDLPETRSLAKNINSRFYFTGKKCKNGHLDKRYTITGNCITCCDKYQKDFKSKNPSYKKDYYLNNEKENVLLKERKKEWRKNNKDKIKKSKEKYKLHPDYSKRVNSHNKKYYKKKRDDIIWRLSKNTSKAIWRWLKKDKGRKHWELLVNFSIDELKKHLESQFRDGMTWDNYGSYWEVDHIKPITKCSNFEEAWSLSNLQPLTALENQKKGNKY